MTTSNITDMVLPENIRKVLDILNNEGHNSFVVGGAVRDHLMGKTPNDFDVCTDALPNDVMKLFADYRIIETGIKHGTVTVMINKTPIEITTFRTEGLYTDNRHPDRIDFTTDIIKDLSRRDFTVNAIAYSPASGYVDPFGGMYDISNHVIRCVGDAEKRFSEDALRILRALRFSSTLDFDIECITSRAIFKTSDNLCHISKERIREELLKLICGDRASKIFTDYSSVFALIIPGLKNTFDYDQNNPHHSFDLYTHLIKTVNNLPKDPILRMAGLLHDIGKPNTASKDESGISHYYSHAKISAEMAETILRDLRFSNNDISRICSIILYHDGVIEENERAVKRRLNQLGSDKFFDLLELQRADNASQTNDIAYRLEHNSILRKISNNVIMRGDCVDASRLALNGNDLISTGLKGKQIGKVLSFLLDAVINGETENTKEALSKLLAGNLDTFTNITQYDQGKDE